MKKLISLFMCVASLSNVAYADAAKLTIKISGAGSANTYFLCTDGISCLSIAAANHGKVYPLTTGQIDHIHLLNVANARMYFQKLPDSCNVSVSEHQTLTVKGQIVKGANDKVFISNLTCSVG